MLVKSLLVAHIAVLGYWLGSELVINSTFRFVTKAGSSPFDHRNQLLDHVMNVDQHVRYALILQLGLGFILATMLGYLPGGTAAAMIAATAATLLIAFVEIAHRRRKSASGQRLAKIDRVIRYLLVLFFVALGTAGLVGSLQTPVWMAAKLILFGAAIACGLGIRLELIRYFALWADIEANGTSSALEARLTKAYWRATTVLIGLWVVIAAITALSLIRP